MARKLIIKNCMELQRMISKYEKRNLLLNDLKKVALDLYWGCNTLNEKRKDQNLAPVSFEVVAKMHGISDMIAADKLYQIASKHLKAIDDRRFINVRSEL